MCLTVKHLEGTKFEVTCLTHNIIVDQPKSEKGTDQGMTPADLLNASLASCVAHYATIFLKRRIPDLRGLEVQGSWQYSENPHRVGAIHVTIITPRTLTEPEREGLLRTVGYCTVENTLKHAPRISIDIRTE
mgnify:CR=1 FL=1